MNIINLDPRYGSMFAQEIKALFVCSCNKRSLFWIKQKNNWKASLRSDCWSLSWPIVHINLSTCVYNLNVHMRVCLHKNATSQQNARITCRILFRVWLCGFILSNVIYLDYFNTFFFFFYISVPKLIFLRINSSLFFERLDLPCYSIMLSLHQLHKMFLNWQ